MANPIVSVHVGIYGMGIYAIMLPSGVFSVAHWKLVTPDLNRIHGYCIYDRLYCCSGMAVTYLTMFPWCARNNNTRPSDVFYILDALIYTLLSSKIYNASSSYC